MTGNINTTQPSRIGEGGALQQALVAEVVDGAFEGVDGGLDVFLGVGGAEEVAVEAVYSVVVHGEDAVLLEVGARLNFVVAQGVDFLLVG